MILSSYSGGITPTIIWFTKPVIVLVPSPAAFTICDIKTDSPAAFLIFHFTEWLSDHQAKYTTNYICLKQIIPIPVKLCFWKLFMITFQSYFLIFITDCQHINIIFYALHTNNNLICFDHALSNLKQITVLIIPPNNLSKSFPF